MTSLSTLARATRLGSTRKRGVTLIEAVLYISIALALIVGGLVFFQQASLAQRVNGAVRNISAIASETRGLYQASGSFANFATGTLINAGAVPSSIIDSAGTGLTNEWGGTITAAANSIAANSNDSFTVSYGSVPTRACVRMATVDAQGSGRVGAGIHSITLSNTGGSAAGSTFLATAGMTPAEAATRCNDADGTNGLVDITYVFTR